MTSFYSVASQIITELNALERLLVREDGTVLSVLSWSTSIQQPAGIHYSVRNRLIRKDTGSSAYHSVRNSRLTKGKMNETDWWNDRKIEVFYCFAEHSVDYLITLTNTCIYIYNLKSIKFTLKHLKRSYMFRSHDHPQGAHIVPC